MMRRLKIYKMVFIAGEDVLQNDGLPDGVNSFFELVQQYSKSVLPDITEEEVDQLINNPLSDYLSLPRT